MSKTTSLELSKQLKEAGCKQESDRCWVSWPVGHGFRDDLQWEKDVDFSAKEKTFASSFDCDELLERLPILSRVEKTQNSLFKADNWWLDDVEIEKSPAEALGKLYLWCLENGHCND